MHGRIHFVIALAAGFAFAGAGDRQMEQLVETLPYDKTDSRSVEQYGRKMVGKSFREIYEQSPTASNYGNPHRKGGLGNLIEECHFLFRANSDSEADISDAGVEVKSTPLEYRASDGKVRAGERLVLTMIPNDGPIDVDFETSHFWSKCRLMLLIAYHRDRTLADNLDYRVKYVKLFTPSAEDLAIIREDYLHIVDKVRTGRAHLLSEGETRYLGACTKGSTAEDSTKPQFYRCTDDGQVHPARRRAFCFKQSYMTYVLNHYLVEGKDEVRLDPIVKDASVLRSMTFEDYVSGLVRPFVGKGCAELARTLGVDYDPAHPAKSLWSTLAMRMLGVRTENAAEFEKAGIEVKAIRLEEDNRMEQNVSFPALDLSRLSTDAWEDSEIYGTLSGARFLFVVFKRRGDDYVFKGLQFWSMPVEQLQGGVRRDWQKIVRVLREGVVLRKTGRTSKSGNPEVENNFPGKSESEVIHLRPHAARASYRLHDGTEFGNPADRERLPTGEGMTRQCFWLNKDFVIGILDARLKD